MPWALLHLFYLDPGVTDVAQTIASVLAQTTPDQRNEPERRIGRQRVPIGIAGDDGGEDIGQRRTRERLTPGQHLVEHAAEGPDVGAAIDGLTSGLLGRHVGSRSEQNTRLCAATAECGRVRQVRVDWRVRQRLRETEVEDLHRPVRRDLQVGRLEIPVDDASLVCVLQRLCNVARDRHRLWQPDRPDCQSLGQRGTFDELHREPADISGVLDAVNRRDAAVIERREHLGFALEPRQAVAVAREGRRQDFDGDVAVQTGIARAVDLAHPTGAKRGEDFVAAKPCACREGHRGCEAARSIPRRECDLRGRIDAPHSRPTTERNS